MEALVAISQLPVLNTNLSELKAQVSTFLANFDFVVTDDGIKFAKEKATELNKLADTLDSLRKEKVREISVPIKAFETEVKEIHGIIKSTRQSLLDQVAVYEAEAKVKVKTLLEQERRSLWTLHGVEGEFQRAAIDDLVILSNITQTGRLTKKADDSLKSRVLADKQTQEVITTRLMTLKGLCLEAGLVAPFERHNVNHFLFSNDYDTQLSWLISAELKRQQEAEHRIAKQLADKQQREIEAIKADAERAKNEAKLNADLQVKQALATAQKSSPIINQQPANITDGDMEYSITVSLKFTHKDMNLELLKEATLRKFEKTGFKGVTNVDIQKVAVGRPKTQAVKSNELRAAGSAF